MFWKQSVVFACALLSIPLLSSRGFAQDPALQLNYTVTSVDDHFRYDFSLLAVAEPDPNVGFGWIIFGDHTADDLSPNIDDFNLTSSIAFSGGHFWDLTSFAESQPWDSVTSSGGTHNGPSLYHVISGWTPSKLGDQVTWSGVSANKVTDLQWSSLIVRNMQTGRQTALEWQPTNPGPVPEPATLLTLTLGTAVLLKRRRK